MPASDETALRAYCARILGWTDERRQDVEHAFHAIRLSIARCATLVLLGSSDLVPIARALHRRALGVERPFVVCARRRQGVSASGVAAFHAARGGSLCLRYERMPPDLPAMAALLRAPASSVTLVVCAEPGHGLHPFLLRPGPIQVPSLRARVRELPRIVDATARDAIQELAAHETGFTSADRDWILEHASSSLPEIEKATRRLVALRQASSINAAATRLGMTHTALSRWISRRGVRR